MAKPTIVAAQAIPSAVDTAFPAHQAGDLFVVFAIRNIGSAPVLNVSLNPIPPAAAGTVPQFVDIFNNVGAQGNYTSCMRVSYAWATAANHTTGAWAQCSNKIVYVIRGADPAAPFGGKAWVKGTNAKNVLFPGVTLQNADDTSALLRIASSMSGSNHSLTLPTGHLQHVNQISTQSILAASKLVTDTAPDAITTASVTDDCWTGSSVEVLGTPPAPPSIRMNVLQGGVWKELTPNVLQSGSWKQPQRVHVLNSGQWKLTYERAVAAAPEYLYGVRMTYLDNYVVNFQVLKGFNGPGVAAGDEAFMFRCTQIPRDGYVGRDFSKTWSANGYGYLDCTLEDLYGYGMAGEKNTRTILRFKVAPKAVGNGVVEEYIAATPEFVN